MDSLQTIERGIEVQETIGFNIFNEVDPVDHESLYGFARIVYNYLKMDAIKNDLQSYNKP